MPMPRYLCLFAAFLASVMLVNGGLAQPQSTACGPDHAIIYKRASDLLDKAEKKLNDKYTAEAKALVKEANSLFSILVKECAPAQQARELSEKEVQQEAINKRLCEDALAQADQLMASAADKEKKGQQAEAQGQAEQAVSLQRQAKSEYERAHVQSIKATIYALRNQEMIFRFLNK
jgi:Xaa-Pro aminopeptidase